MIGDTAYDPKTNGDGYADYDVTYDDAKYREGNDGEYNDEPTWWMNRAAHITQIMFCCARTTALITGLSM